jgi:predicted RNA-binding protein with PUA-like domain
VTSVDFQTGDDIQRAYFDPDCDSTEDPYNQVDVSNMFPQSMDDPVMGVNLFKTQTLNRKQTPNRKQNRLIRWLR